MNKKSRKKKSKGGLYAAMANISQLALMIQQQASRDAANMTQMRTANMQQFSTLRRRLEAFEKVERIARAFLLDLRAKGSFTGDWVQSTLNDMDELLKFHSIKPASFADVVKRL